MNDKDNIEINFDDKYEEIIAAMQKRHEAEEEASRDILSDSRYIGGKHSYEDVSSNSSKYGKKKRSFKAWWRHLTKGKKAALISVTSVVLVIAILLGWFFSYFKYNYNSITDDPESLGFSGVIDKNVINVALFGVDSRDENKFTGNTDSIMILSLNTETKKVKITSVMRDTLVPMEYEGKKYCAKINSAYTKGPEHAIKTLNQIFDLDISEYATVNFYGMVDIIDAVGGITATITEDELKWKGNDHPNLNNCMDEICSQMGLDAKNYYIKSAGEQQLNGVQAVAYSRVRNCTSVWGTRDDFGRTDRQRHVMQELFNKADTMKKTQYPKRIKALIPCSETSLSYGDIFALAVDILLSSPAFEQYRLPPAEYQSKFLMRGPSGYGSIIYYDLDYAAKLLHAVIYEDMTMEQYIEQNGIETNSWYASWKSSGSTGSSTGSTGSSNKKPSATTSSQQTTSSGGTSSVTSSNNNTSSVVETSSEEITSSEETPSSDAEGTSKPEDTSSTDSSSDTSSIDSSSETPSGDDEGDGETTSTDTPTTPDEPDDDITDGNVP